MAKDNNGWDEYKKLILFSLETAQREIAVLKDQHDRIQREFTEFVIEYRQNITKVKAYLTVGVAIGTGVLQVGLYFIQHIFKI